MKTKNILMGFMAFALIICFNCKTMDKTEMRLKRLKDKYYVQTGKTFDKLKEDENIEIFMNDNKPDFEYTEIGNLTLGENPISWGTRVIGNSIKDHLEDAKILAKDVGANVIILTKDEQKRGATTDYLYSYNVRTFVLAKKK